jgi:hypothetical protein
MPFVDDPADGAGGGFSSILELSDVDCGVWQLHAGALRFASLLHISMQISDEHASSPSIRTTQSDTRGTTRRCMAKIYGSRSRPGATVNAKFSLWMAKNSITSDYRTDAFCTNTHSYISLLRCSRKMRFMPATFAKPLGSWRWSYACQRSHARARAHTHTPWRRCNLTMNKEKANEI